VRVPELQRKEITMNLLIKKARGHDKAAFQQLMEEQMQSLYKVAKAILKNEEDVADAMQDTVLTCWEKIDTLKKDKYFKTWLIRILINHCNAIYRQRTRIVSEESVSEPWIQENGYTDVEWENFLNCLEEKYRVVIMLYYVQGFKTREIAKILEVNENTIRGRLAAARKKLESQYKAEGNIIRTVEFEEKTSYGVVERRI
jgi:RNA polymerase sigma factor (sigma-70 family)